MLKVIDGILTTVDYCYGHPGHPANYILVSLYVDDRAQWYNKLRVVARVALDGTVSPVRGSNHLAPTEADIPAIRKAIETYEADSRNTIGFMPWKVAWQ